MNDNTNIYKDGRWFNVDINYNVDDSGNIIDLVLSNNGNVITLEPSEVNKIKSKLYKPVVTKTILYDEDLRGDFDSVIKLLRDFDDRLNKLEGNIINI